MAASQMSKVLQHLRSAVHLQEGAGRSDGQLVESFVSCREEAAIELLVRRHASMVWGVCRRILSDYHDAEDAFQATFLVLVRKAGSIKPREMVGNWLYGVAHQTALKARATAAKRRTRERQVTVMPELAETEQDLGCDLQAVLDQELSRLPDKYRVAIVLCDLEGKTRKTAARQLGCPEGTLAARLARGRVLLAKRLARQSLALSGGALAGLLSRQAAAACVPTSVVSYTVKAASLVAAGQGSVALITVKVAALTEGVLKTMLLTKLKVATVVLLAMTVGAGAGGLIYRTQAAESPLQGTNTKPLVPQQRAQGDNDLLEQARARALIEEQQRKQLIKDAAVKEARRKIEKILKEVEEKGGDVQTSREVLEEIGNAVKEMREATQAKQRDKTPIWALDFRFKNLRLVSVDVPGQGKKTVCYCWYEVINNSDAAHTFLADFELATSTKVVNDAVLPKVLDAVRHLEDPARVLDVKNSVTIADAAIPPSKQGADTRGVAGVALWDEVDADAKSFTLFVSGLTNAWSFDGDSPRRKTLKLTFKRVANEMQPIGPAEWVYRSIKRKGDGPRQQ